MHLTITKTGYANDESGNPNQTQVRDYSEVFSLSFTIEPEDDLYLLKCIEHGFLTHFDTEQEAIDWADIYTQDEADARCLEIMREVKYNRGLRSAL
jgi:hypothetical protein